MPRLAFKPDSSFFRKIVIGAVGTRAIRADLQKHKHEIIELERGSLDTKLWKDVKRKRVRIPDLLCPKCGLRIESRAKTKLELAMSHSSTDQTRAWDFGMVDGDYIAFPVCEAAYEENWSSGRLRAESSYWHEKNWVNWKCTEYINYFEVKGFRSTKYNKSSIKGVTEGSETIISWDAKFSNRDGVVESIIDRKVKIRRLLDSHCYSWAIPENLTIWVSQGECVKRGQIIASSVRPISCGKSHRK